MAYVTEDKRVQEIVKRLKSHGINRASAARQIKSLPPQEGAHFGYLDWEVEEALKAAA